MVLFTILSVTETLCPLLVPEPITCVTVSKYPSCHNLDKASKVPGKVDTWCVGDTNASSELSLSHMVSENLPPRPSIVLDSSSLPRQRSADQPQAPAPPDRSPRPETMC